MQIVHALPLIEVRERAKRKKAKHPYGRRPQGATIYPDDLIAHIRYLLDHGCKRPKIASVLHLSPLMVRDVCYYKTRPYIDPQRSIAYPSADEVKAA